MSKQYNFRALIETISLTVVELYFRHFLDGNDVKTHLVWQPFYSDYYNYVKHVDVKECFKIVVLHNDMYLSKCLSNWKWNKHGRNTSCRKQISYAFFCLKSKWSKDHMQTIYLWWWYWTCAHNATIHTSFMVHSGNLCCYILIVI